MKLLNRLVVFLLAISLVGCSSGNHTTEKTDDVKVKRIELGLNENVKDDEVGEFYVEYTNITNKVTPPKMNSYYSYYEAEQGKVYVDISIPYKNLTNQGVCAEDIVNAKLIYDEKYEYTGFSIIEEKSRGDFTYSGITNVSPLTIGYLHYLFEVPSDVKSGEGKIQVELELLGNVYIVNVDRNNKQQISSSNMSESQINGNSGDVKPQNTTIKVQEKQTLEYCEFYVDYAQITSKVMPKVPASFYSYYEAEQGKTYVDVCVAYKNTDNAKIMADDCLSAKLIYAGDYEYTGFSIIEEDNRGDFTYSSITSIDPLCTEYVHYLFEVPKEVEKSSESIIITLIVENESFDYVVR